MKIKFFGTAAAEGIPALFCECEICEKARKIKGKEIRTRSQSLIDDKILIDFPADTYHHILANDLPLHKIYNLIITHSHSDHLYPSELINRKTGFAALKDNSPFNVYAVKSVIDEIKEKCDKVSLSYMLENRELTLNEIKTFETFFAEDYEITPLKAIHGTEEPVIYLIKKDNKSLLYAHDTNYFDESVWEYLSDNKIFLNCVSLDCTQANDEKMNYIGHMNLNDNIKVKERLIKMGCADESSLFICNHFSHNGSDSSYDVFSEIAMKSGFLTSYDGMTAEF